MTIVVEDGTLVTSANSYVTEAELTAYAVARGVTLSGDTEQLLIQSMDYIESLEYKGIKRTEDQALQWPRGDVVVDSYLLDLNEIPQLLKNSEMQVAMAIDGGEDPLADIPRLKTRASVGSVSVEYATGSSTTTVRKITAQLRKLLSGGNTGISFPVDRG